MNENILIKNATLLYDNNKILDNYAVFIEDEIIKEVGASQILENKHKNNNIKLIDAEHKLVLSGFINAHMHFYSTFARVYCSIHHQLIILSIITKLMVAPR
jgi:cytosine/adenosine deaminase-related metal-dependent hydrolase